MQFKDNESIVKHLNNSLKYLLGQRVELKILTFRNNVFTLVCENGVNSLYRYEGYKMKTPFTIDELDCFFEFPIEANIYGC